MLRCFNKKSKKIIPNTIKDGDKIHIYENKKKLSTVIVGNPSSIQIHTNTNNLLT